MPVARGWIVAAMILCWPLAIAALLAAGRAARAHGAGDDLTAVRAASSARTYAGIGALVGGVGIVGCALVAGLVALAVVTDPATSNNVDPAAAAPAPASYRTAAAPHRETIVVETLALQEGDCFVDPGSFARWPTLDVIPCSRLHDAQVIAVTPLGDGDYPGSEAVSTAAWDDCATAYEEYSGSFLTEHSPVWTLQPTQGDWNDEWHTSVCFVLVDAPVRGDLRDHPELLRTEAAW